MSLWRSKISAGEAPEDGLVWLHLLDDPYRLVLPRGHRLAARQA